MSSIFSKIIDGTIPSHKVAEDEHYYAFLDINPLAKGHTLVIPKVEIDYIFDLEDDTLSGLVLFSKKVGKAIQSVIPCNRIGIMVLGLEVPHAHVHLIPINKIGDMNFSNPKLALTNEEFAEIAREIRASL